MTTKPIDIHKLLARQRQIAILWSTDDVREVRRDLTDDQCWEVLKVAENQLDATCGLSWDTLQDIADDLFGNPE